MKHNLQRMEDVKNKIQGGGDGAAHLIVREEGQRTRKTDSRLVKKDAYKSILQ